MTCLSCHQAEPGDVDAFEHADALIATLVTPKDCGRCHARAAEEVGSSYHATAGQILDSADAYLAHLGLGDEPTEPCPVHYVGSTLDPWSEQVSFDALDRQSRAGSGGLDLEQ